MEPHELTVEKLLATLMAAEVALTGMSPDRDPARMLSSIQQASNRIDSDRRRSMERIDALESQLDAAVGTVIMGRRPTKDEVEAATIGSNFPQFIVSAPWIAYAMTARMVSLGDGYVAIITASTDAIPVDGRMAMEEVWCPIYPDGSPMKLEAK
jgi:hypothetical protein